MKVLNQNAPTQTPQADHSSRRTVLILIGITVLLISLVVGIIVSRQSQTTENKASEVGPTCPLNGFVCSWQKEEGVTYSCTILEVKSDGTTAVVANPDVTAGTTEGEMQCVHTPLPDKTYRCSVTATRFEGCSTTATGDTSCLTVTSTPTPTPTPTVTPTPTPTPHPMCYITTCNPQTLNHCATQGLANHTCVDTDLTQAGTDYRCVSNPACTNPTATNPAGCWCAVPTPSVTPTPTPTGTTPTPTTASTPTPTTGSTPTPTTVTQTTPTPTDIVVVNRTTTTTPAPTTAMTTTTPVPTLPVAGLPLATYLIVLVGIAVVAVGLAL